MRFLVTALTITVLLSAISCSEVPNRTLMLRVSNENPDVVARTDALLLSRFSMFNSALLTGITSTSDGSILTYIFPGEEPDNATIEYLYESIGQLTMTLSESPDVDPIITNPDIANFESRRGDDGNDLFFFELTPSAGDRMLNTSIQNIGKRMVMKVDDLVLMDATIRGAFGGRFQANAGDIENDRAVYAVINFGPLPSKVELVSFEDGT